MRAAFVSFQFRSPEDPLFDSERDIQKSIEDLLTDHGIRPVTGRRLGGQQITDEVKRLIEQSDCLVAVMTRRDRLADGDRERYTTSDWVKAELAWARTSEKRAIAMVERGVELAGPDAQHEYIPLDRAKPLPAMMALSATIGRWRREAGYARVVRLLPDDIGQQVRLDGRYQCRYRQRRGSLAEPWRPGEPVVEPGGTFLYVEGIRDDAGIEVEIREGDRTRWWSPVTPQFIPVELQETE